jgi:hypothetical protein
VRLGFCRSQAARRPLRLKQMITKRATVANPGPRVCRENPPTMEALKAAVRKARLAISLSDHSTGALARFTSSAQVIRGTEGSRARPTRSLGESGPSFSM